MSKIGEFITWIILSLVLVWISGMVFAGNPCTRVNRSAWPVTYTMTAVEALTENWTTDSTKLSLLLWKANGSVAVQSFFEKTVYGKESKCKK